LKSRNWKDIAELVGITAIVASLIFVGIQLQQDRRIALSDYMSNWSDRADTISELISDNAAVWNKACLGHELTAEERIIASQIFSRLLSHKTITWGIYREGVFGSPDDGPAEQLAVMAWRYPGVRAMLEEIRAKGVEMERLREGFDIEVSNSPMNADLRTFGRTTSRILAELDRSTPTPDSVHTTCGVP
jgi:hypothetical protein